MKAVAVFPSRKTIEVIDHPVPALGGTEDVRLKMLEVGVCGTDREIAAFEYGTPPDGSEYLVIGHESLGEVVETGSAVTGLKVGDLVVTMVRRPCNHPECVACRAGRQDFCFTGDFTERGIKQQHGFMTEQVVDHQKYMNVVPGTLRDVAILVEPLTIAEKALIQVGEVQRRLPWGLTNQAGEEAKVNYQHNAVVLGAGPVGLLGAMALIAAGFKTYVYSRAADPQEKMALLASIGGTFIAAEQTPVEKLPDLGGNIDLVYEAVGASSMAIDVMRIIGTNSVFVFTGVPGRKGPISIDADLIMRNLVLKNQVVFGTVNASKTAFEYAIRDLEQFNQKWPEAVRKLITGRYPMEGAKDLLIGKSGGIKNVIHIG